MTKKDYIKVANVISYSFPNNDDSKKELVDCLCRIMLKNHKLFDRNKFETACGLTN